MTFCHPNSVTKVQWIRFLLFFSLYFCPFIRRSIPFLLLSAPDPVSELSIHLVEVLVEVRPPRVFRWYPRAWPFVRPAGGGEVTAAAAAFRQSVGRRYLFLRSSVIIVRFFRNTNAVGRDLARAPIHLWRTQFRFNSHRPLERTISIRDFYIQNRRRVQCDSAVYMTTCFLDEIVRC